MRTVFRTVEEDDLEDIYQLALNAGFGITTLSKNKRELSERITRSINSFEKNISQPINENYFFVLEDIDSKKIIGTSAIEAAVGHDLPFYAYRVSNISNICHRLEVRVNYQVLNLNNDFQGKTEIGTLYLDPNYRVNKNGVLLSKARFLFMALMPERFSEEVIAEMRGVSNEDGDSPFWNSFGKHFFKMSFIEADELSVLTDKQFISDLLPQHPVHVNLLSMDAQNAIAKPHVSTVPAMKILEREGFYTTPYVDIFDAGPAIKAKLKNIKTIKNKKLCRITKLVETLEGKHYFISNTKKQFRAIYSVASIEAGDVILLKEDASALMLGEGDYVQLI